MFFLVSFYLFLLKKHNEFIFNLIEATYLLFFCITSTSRKSVGVMSGNVMKCHLTVISVTMNKKKKKKEHINYCIRV